jgi:DNA-binding beta-propeller fold protein YncE
MLVSAKWKGVCVALGMWLVAGALAGCAADSGASAPQRIAVDARPNGIAVRPGAGTLFITDDATNSVLSAPDGQSFTRFAALPPASGQDRNSLSELVFADPRLLLVARFGFGTAGALVAVATQDGGPPRITTFSGPDPARRRLGLAVLAPDQVLSTWFVKSGNAPQYGGLSLLTYDPATGRATEQDWLTGLAKPVGVAVAGGNVYVSDEAGNRILKARIDTLRAAPQPASAATVVAHIDGPDLLAASHDGTLYTKCGKTGFCTIAADGTVTQIANDFHDARGVALDETRGVLYVIDRANEAKPAQGADTKDANRTTGPNSTQAMPRGTSAVRVLPLR